MKLWLPFLRSIGDYDDGARGGGVCSTNAGQDQKPAFRCFGFQEISEATNDFHPGNCFRIGVVFHYVVSELLLSHLN
jgi:hypothetical protein